MSGPTIYLVISSQEGVLFASRDERARDRVLMAVRRLRDDVGPFGDVIALDDHGAVQALTEDAARELLEGP